MTPKPLPGNIEQMQADALAAVRAVWKAYRDAGLSGMEAAHATIYTALPGTIPGAGATYTMGVGGAAHSKARAVKAEPKRHLRLEVTGQPNLETLLVRVAEQSHRGDDFTPGGHGWTAPNGMQLFSEVCPHYTPSPGRAWFRGSMPASDDVLMHVPIADVARLFEAVAQYNEEFGGGS